MGTTLIVFVVKLAVAILLPFFVLIRAAVYLYQVEGIPGWLALAGASALALGLLTIYGAWISRKLTGRARFGLIAKWVALPLVLVYCGYTLLFLSSVNAKTDEVRSYYQSLHPLLRVAVSTLIIADEGIVITDLKRSPADYVAMGLPIQEASLHYPQDDGYVHAMDVRTLGRNGLRNWSTQLYFRLMGFRTLRHAGTAQHLHVALPVPM